MRDIQPSPLAIRGLAVDNAAMNSIVVSLIASLCICCGGLGGLYAYRLLPDSHLTRETQDVVRLGIGMISVLASLVLGLLIATAKGSYDTTNQAVRAYAAELALLNETLRDFGGPASVPRDILRDYAGRLIGDIWPADNALPNINDNQAERLLEHVRERIRSLNPVDDGQKWLRDQALTINTELLRQRWLLIGDQQRNVSPIVLGILVSWITVIFLSFGLNAPRNGTVCAAFVVCSLTIGGSIFLILEMDRPLTGIMQISSAPMREVTAQMSW